MMQRTQRRRCSGERGVSLIELLIAITISAILTAPIGLAIYFVTRTTNEAQARLVQSDKAKLVASYFSPDVESAISVQTGVSDTSCGGAATKTVDLLLHEATGTVSYYHEANGSSQVFLYRRVCNGTAITAGPIKVSNTLPAQQTNPVDQSALANPSFNCPGCTTTGWTEVKLILTQQDWNDIVSSANKNRYQTVLEATKRVNGA
jgi:prepilin-type N-terminal cleavage/methylation domain-containing protein